MLSGTRPHADNGLVMRLLRNMVLFAIATGMLAAAATQQDAFIAQVQALCALGAFALAFVLPGT